MTAAPATPGPGIRLSGDAPPSHPHPAPAAVTVTTSTATHSNRPTPPRHRADPDPTRATKAAWRSYQRTRAARRRDRLEGKEISARQAAAFRAETSQEARR